ncbi:MAG: hypothetical protein IPJ06_14605 [Saprospiraceae bacterium]|nr:hypothetical protein [Saprospiraceae bacterium]
MTLTGLDNGCIGLDTTVVLAETSKPVINPFPVPGLTCVETTAQIQVSVPSPASGVTLQWSTPNGLILGATDSLIITAGAAGNYTLLAVDTLSGCMSTWTTAVVEDVTIPVVQLPAQDTLGCQQVELSAIATLPPGRIRCPFSGLPRTAASMGPLIRLSPCWEAKDLHGAGGKHGPTDARFSDDHSDPQ